MKWKLFSLLCAVLFLLTMSSCTFSTNPEWKIDFAKNNSSNVILSKTIRVENGSATLRLDSGTFVKVISRFVEDGFDGYIIENTGGERFKTYADLGDTGLPAKYVNMGRTHYVDEIMLEGRTIQDIVNEWGDYAIHSGKYIRDSTKQTYSYPQVCFATDNVFYEGITLITKNGRIVDAHSYRRVHNNAFSKLPLFREIILLNIPEHIQTPIIVDSPYDCSEDVGVIKGSFYGAIWIYALLIFLSACIFMTIKLFESYTRLHRYLVYAISALIFLPLAYIALIILFNEYHNSWWFLAFNALVVVGLFFYIPELGEKQCSRCRSYSWNIEEIPDSYGVTRTVYPNLIVSRNAFNDVCYDVEFKVVKKYPWIRRYKCRNCGEVESENFYKDFVSYQNECPRCGYEKGRGFWKVKTTGDSGTEVRGVYTELCPSCGYTFNITFKTPISSPRIMETSKPMRRKESEEVDSTERHRNDCRYCKYFRNGDELCCHKVDKSVNLFHAYSTQMICPWWEYSEY